MLGSDVESISKVLLQQPVSRVDDFEKYGV